MSLFIYPSKSIDNKPIAMAPNTSSHNYDSDMRKPPLPSSSSSTNNNNAICMDRKLSDSTGEPSLTNTTLSDCYHEPSFISQQHLSNRPLHIAFPLHSNSSLLDMAKDDGEDSQDEDEDLYLTAKSIQAFDDDDSHVNFHAIQEPTSITRTSSLIKLSESISTSFCTTGSEVITNDIAISNPCTAPDCSSIQICGEDHPDGSQPQTMQFSDRILQNRIMQDLNYILGSTATPCCMERSLFSDCFGNSLIVRDTHTVQMATSYGDKVRNRAGESWRARAYRIRRLREEKMLQEGFQPHSLVTSQSMDGLRGGLIWKNVNKRENYIGSNVYSQQTQSRREKDLTTPKARPKQEVQYEPLGCMIGDCIGPISPVEGNDFEVELKNNDDNFLDDDDFCYDSDPGIMSTHHRTRSDSVISNHSLSASFESPRPRRCKSDGLQKSPRKKWFKSPMKRQRKVPVDAMENPLDIESEINTKVSFDEPNVMNMPCRHVSLLDSDEDILDNIQETMNQLWTLTWHPSQKTSNSKFSKSVYKSRTVQVWFERGNRIHHSDIVEPKLMWRDAYHPELSSSRRLNTSTLNGPHQVCLLSICRVLDAKNLDRDKYPFAMKSCSFLIKTSDDEEYLFEAESQNKRDELVHSWKLVIARLASIAVVGDGEGMVGEFFVPSSFGVRRA